MRLPAALIICATAVLAACNASPQRDAIASTHSSFGAVKVPNDGLIPLTPDGDLGDWVKDIRRGIARIPAQAKIDAPAAQRVAIELYVSRQEYNEMYYGMEGRNHVSDELAHAIETAEEHFHVLMRLLGTKDPSPVAVADAVDALDAQQAHVAKLWKKTGAHINRPEK